MRNLLLCASCVATLLSAGAFAQNRKPTNEELRIGTTQEHDNLNPLIGSMSASSYIRAFTSRVGLTYMNENNKWATLDAVKIPSLENGLAKFQEEGGKKKLFVTWEIKKEAVWADGTPITGYDYEFSWIVARNENVGYAGDKAALDAIERFEIDKNNPKKFTVVYQRPRWDFYKGLGALPKHIEGSIFEANKDKPQGYDQNSKYSTEPTLAGLWSGPYIIKDVKQGSHVELVQNPKWWGEKPKIKKILIRVIPNNSTLEANLLSGEIDAINQIGLSFDQAVEFQNRVAKEKLPYKVIFEPGLVYEHIDFNLDNPILKDLRVRQALVHAVNREELVKSLFGGKQPVAHHDIHPADPWFPNKKDIVIYEYNPRKAKQLLDAAGWKEGKDGIREKDGKKLVIKIGTTAGNKIRENVQQYLKDSLKKVGVELEIKNEQAKVFFGETTKKRQFDLAMYAWVSSPESVDGKRSNFMCKNIPSEQNSYAGQNYPGWCNAEVDKLLDQLEVEFDPVKRKEISSKITGYYTKELPVWPLYYRANNIVIPANMTGIKLPMTSYHESYHAERWELK